MEGIRNIRKICRASVRRDRLSQVLEASQQRVVYRAGFQLPHWLELIVIGAVLVALLAKLPPDDLSSAELRLCAVAVAQRVELAIQIGEAVVDCQDVVDVPCVRNGRANVGLIGGSNGVEYFALMEDIGGRRAVEIENAVGVRGVMNMTSIDRDIEDVVLRLPLKSRLAS